MLLQVVYVPGNTMLMDFPFQAYYQHLGHWLELAVPMYNVLRDGSWLEHTRSGSKVGGQPHGHAVGGIKQITLFEEGGALKLSCDQHCTCICAAGTGASHPCCSS